MKRLPFILGLGLACTHAEAANEVIKPTGDPNDPGPKPVKNRQGTYDCMRESMKRKQVTEPQTARRFIRWGEPVKETFQRYVYWSIELEYEASIVFGKAEVLIHALVRGGIVHIWMYRGSGEIVP